MKVISFFSAKGGTGKTTFNMLLASYLKYEKGQRVMLLDFDAPEYNLSFCRKRELAGVKEAVDESALYPIEAVRDLSEGNLATVAGMVRKMEGVLDYVVMDFKGSFLSGDPVCVMAEAGVLDMVVIPVELDAMIVASMKSLALLFKENGQQALLFFNRVHGKERPTQYEAVRRWFEEHGCRVARSQVKGNIGMKREQGEGHFVRSTLCFPGKEIRKSNPGIVGLLEEVIGYDGD